MSADRNSSGEESDGKKANTAGPRSESEGIAEAALKAGIAEVDTPEKADRTIDTLEKAGGSLSEVDAQAATRELSLEEKAHSIAAAGAHASSEEKPAAVLAETAAQIAGGDDDERKALDEVVAHTTGVNASGPALSREDVQLQRGRRLLRKALMRRLRPLDALDAILFLQINRLPHPRAIDRLMLAFTNIMHRGDGWLLMLLVLTLFDRKRGVRARRGVAPALWLATATVEFPIKHFFRRKRPFSSIVRAIIVGRKPGSYSFPSGHSAAAFAGAALLPQFYPKGRRFFRTIAALVGFSRIYLGAHYPGDVVTGALTGFALARIYRRILREIGDALKG